MKKEINLSTEIESKTHLLRINEVAKLLAVSERALWRLIANGDLPKPVKIGRSARLFQTDVESYLTNLREKREHSL